MLAEDVQELLRPPAGMAQAQGEEGLLDLRRGFVMNGLCGVRALEQSVGADFDIAHYPFVAGLTTDIVECTEVGNGMSGRAPIANELDTLFHSCDFTPRHEAPPVGACYCIRVLPIRPDYRVTYPPGPYRSAA